MTITQPQGFLALPPSGRGPGILVLHAWWGLNDTIKAFCTRLADTGFIAFAPDLYHGKIAGTIPEAEALGGALDANFFQVKTEIADAVNFLSSRAEQTEGAMAVIGFSMGAYYALDLSITSPDRIHSVVIFYGTGDQDFANSKAAYLGHFAENDVYEPRANVDHLENALKQTNRPVTFHHYPETGHWFFEPDRLRAFNQVASDLAWDRTLEFLKRATEL